MSINEEHIRRDSNQRDEGVTLLEHRHDDSTTPFKKIKRKLDKDKEDYEDDSGRGKRIRKAKSFDMYIESTMKKLSRKKSFSDSQTEEPDDIKESSSSPIFKNLSPKIDKSTSISPKNSNNTHVDENDVESTPEDVFTPEYLHEDETLIMLDRMRDLTSRALHLEVCYVNTIVLLGKKMIVFFTLQSRLRKDYLRRRDETITLGPSQTLNIGNSLTVCLHSFILLIFIYKYYTLTIYYTL